MAKSFTVELTERDIDILQICISTARIDLEKSAAILADCNKSGINSAALAAKHNCMRECDRLFYMLLRAADC